MAPGIKLISSLPNFVTQEQHRELTSSTPASFAEIPAILFHREENASITLDPPLEGFPIEDSLNGTVYVLSSVLVFASSSGKCLEVAYPTISLHAISRTDLGSSIYCQLDELANAEQEPTQDEEDATELRELRINVQSPESLEPMFEALSRCAALHPDKEDVGSEEGFEDAFLDAEEPNQGIAGQGDLSEAGRAILDRLETLLSDPHAHLAEDNSEEEGAGQPNAVDTPLRQPNGVNR